VTLCEETVMAAVTRHLEIKSARTLQLGISSTFGISCVTNLNSFYATHQISRLKALAPLVLIYLRFIKSVSEMPSLSVKANYL